MMADVERRLTDSEDPSHIVTDQGPKPSMRYVYYVAGLLALINAFNYMDRMALSVLMPLLKKDLVLSDSQLGLLVGFAFSIFYAVCGLPIARWADRGVRRDIIALSIAVWSIMTALGGAAQNFWQLLLTRIGVGAGEAGCIPVGYSLISDYVPIERRAGIFALQTLGVMVGTMAGMVLAGWLGTLFGWRMTFVILGLPGIALAILVMLTLKEPVRGQYDGGAVKGSPLPIGATLRSIFAVRTYRLLVLFTTTSAFNAMGLLAWLPSMYTRSYDLPLAKVGLLFGVANGIGQGVGLLLVGAAAQKLAKRDLRYPLFLSAGTATLAIPFGIATLLVGDPYVSMICACIMGGCLSSSLGPVLSGMANVIDPQSRATAGAISTFLQSIIGFGLGPFFVGLLSDALTASYGADALRHALIPSLLTIPLMAFALYAAAKRLPDDLAAARVANAARG